MLTPVPPTCPDKKDAVLWSLFDRLQKIDENEGSRIAFATNIAYNAHAGMNGPMFSNELALIRDVLNIPVPKEEVKPVEAPRSDEPVSTATRLDFADL